MPGFNIVGGEQTHDGASLTRGKVEVRRVHRWVFETMSGLDQSIFIVLKTASRPTLATEEPVMFHDQERIYLAGQHTWEPCTLTWYDTEQSPDCSTAIWNWLNKTGSVGGPLHVPEMWVEKPEVYKGVATLAMTDGHGDATEKWTFYNGWPKDINWNATGLDYSSTELALIEVKYRYDRAVKTL
jgi:hypothetical protein